MIVIKLGGSVISNKNKPFSFNEDIVKQIATEIKKFYPEKKFLLVHGGGSFGHPLAKKYEIRKGMSGIKRMIGFSKTHEAMLELNKKIVNIFLEKNLPVFSISTSSIFLMDNGKMHGNVSIIKELLNLEFIPILFGDVVLTRDKGIDILSGDKIISHVAKKIEAEKVIFLMDVDGIYNKNPSEKDAELIDEIDRSIQFKATTGKFDVTGGIENKLKEAFKLHCPVYFINGMVKGNLTKAIKGRKIGTRIKQ